MNREPSISLSRASKRAILFFTRSPESEAASKPLAGSSYAERLALYRDLIARTLRETLPTHIDVIVATDFASREFDAATAVIKQRGNTFDDRLNGAVKDTFALGYDELVVIGNDCLDLTASHLKKAFDALATTDLVLGEATDGGVYLIALKSAAQPQSLFAQCRWETNHVQADLLATAAQCGYAVTVLERRADLDTAQDVLRAAHTHRDNSSLAHLAFQITRRLLTITSLSTLPPTPQLPAQHLRRLRHQKAPPVLA